MYQILATRPALLTVLCHISGKDSRNSYQADGGISIKDDFLGNVGKIPKENVLLIEKVIKHEILKDFDSLFNNKIDFYADN